MLKGKLNEIKVKELMKKPEIFLSPKEVVSSVIGKMKKHKTYALPVKKGKKYVGMITAQEIVSERIPPTTTEIKSLITYPPLIPSNTSLAEACDKMWRNDLRTIPVGDNKELKGILTFWDVVDWCLKQEDLKKFKVDEIETRDIPVLNVHEQVDKAKIKLRNKRLTKLLVGDGRINKILGTKNLVKKLSKIPRESMTLGERKGEKTKRLGIESRSVTRKIKVRVKKNNSIHELLKEMKRFNSNYAVLDESVITFKDILRFLGEYKEDLTRKVVFINKSKLDDLTWNHMKMDLQDFLQIYNKKFGKDSIRDFRITIRDLHTTGDKTKFIMSAKLLTDLRDFYAKKEGWDAIDVFDDLIGAVRRQIWP
jgi:CBS domain-containing protein